MEHRLTLKDVADQTVVVIVRGEEFPCRSFMTEAALWINYDEAGEGSVPVPEDAIISLVDSNYRIAIDKNTPLAEALMKRRSPLNQ